MVESGRHRTCRTAQDAGVGWPATPRKKAAAVASRGARDKTLQVRDDPLTPVMNCVTGAAATPWPESSRF